MCLVEITESVDSVILELAYATADNFTGAPVYRRTICYLHEDAAVCLQRAVDLARPLGLTIKIFDAFRPAEAQWRLWNHTPDPDFLADPRRGSPHSRGAAVDLTLVDSLSGVPLDMGTPFDTFSLLSHHANRDVSPEVQKNRFLLLGLMSAAGWDFYSREWWHYQLFNARARYPVFSDLALPQTRRLMEF